MANDFSKLMLRAYNAEAENVVRSLRAGNTALAIKRLDAARAAIAKLGAMMEMRISDDFHRLRVAEIELTADYQMKKEEEREAAREERERLREERKVQQNIYRAFAIGLRTCKIRVLNDKWAYQQRHHRRQRQITQSAQRRPCA